MGSVIDVTADHGDYSPSLPNWALSEMRIKGPVSRLSSQTPSLGPHLARHGFPGFAHRLRCLSHQGLQFQPGQLLEVFVGWQTMGGDVTSSTPRRIGNR
jgi:hypothetical protein